jgi:DNA polymerase-3 subunit epsilon
MISSPLVVLDTETTGVSPQHDRITEIALIRFEDGVEVSRWQSLINPGISIPAHITYLTGISNEMVKDAPSFKEVAAELYGHLEGAVMAAHNAKFDFNFLKAEYGRLGGTFRQKLLCTVKLSRKLYPQHKGHGLDAIMQRHGLRTNHRHRAMGDVELVVDYLRVAKNELGDVQVGEAVSELIKGPKLPTGLDADFLEQIPEGAGVYIFYGEAERPLYIGKSVNLRARVLSHFSDNRSAKDARITQEIKRVEWIETAGELGALLLESRMIKELQPAYNSLLRFTKRLFSLRMAQGLNQTPLVTIVTDDEIHPGIFDYLFGIFRTKKGAQEALRNLVNEHQLCLKALWLESGKGACFASQLKRCQGACCGKESPEIHYVRLRQALMSLRLKTWPFQGRVGFKEQSGKLSQIHVFDEWCYLGVAEDDVQLDELLQLRSSQMVFDLDTYKLLTKVLGKPMELIHY